jgi:hypothetical protein
LRTARRGTIARAPPTPLHGPQARIASSGTVVVVEHTSRVLADNPLGDPHVRKLAVWLPPGTTRDAARPAQRARAALSRAVRPRRLHGSGLAHVNWRPFDENVPERAARLIAERQMGPAIVVFPDCFTSLGGNQYVNSSAIGATPTTSRASSSLRRPRVPHARIARASRLLRQVVGRLRRDHPRHASTAKYWGAIADHSGDAYFEWCYLPDWPRTLNELARYRRPPLRAGKQTRARSARADGRDDGRVRRFLNAMWERRR